MRQSSRSRTGFTLIELLMVIVIIAMLMGLLAAGVWYAQLRALDARVIAEIGQLDSAIKKHKANYGAYPPDFSYTPYATAHIRRMFPRYTGTPTAVPLSPAEAFVYWLGGVPAMTGSTKITGFSLNPNNPFATGGQRTAPEFEFDQSRLRDIDGDGFWEYYPPNSTAPYVYFEWRTYANHTASNIRPYRRHDPGAAAMSATTPWTNPETFQIISAGRDADYGFNGEKGFPWGTNYATGDLDNLTNFHTSTLEDARP